MSFWSEHRHNLHTFRPRLLDALEGYNRGRFMADLGAGVTVGVVALPLAMAFAIASGVKPEAGLFTAIIAGLLISALGGSHVQIGGPAGAFIVIIYGIVERYGLANLFIATSLAGVLLFVMGLFKLGALVRFIPLPIVIGFTNGIAVLIGLSQIKDLLGLDIDKLPADFFSQIGTLASHLQTFNPAALVMGMICLMTVVLWPKSYLMAAQPQRLSERWRRRAAHVPGTVVALAGATLATWVFSLPVETIGSRFGGIPSALPTLAFPDFSWTSAKQLLAPTLTIALLGAIESLLCARVADNMAPLKHHDPNQELMAQGVANFVTPFFGGIPATGTIARTVTNVRAGGTSPIAGIVHALTLLLIVWVAAPWAEHVPLAAMAGILLFVAWNMGEWRQFPQARKFTLPYRIILFGTFFLTVVFDLTVAVEVGLVLACAFFIWRMGTLFAVRDLDRAALPQGLQAFEMFGSLFFGAVGQIERLPQRLKPGSRAVLLDMHRLISMDTSGLDALEQLHRELERHGIKLYLANLTEQPSSLISRSGFEQSLGPGRIGTSMAEAVALYQAQAASEMTAGQPPGGPG